MGGVGLAVVLLLAATTRASFAQVETTHLDVFNAEGKFEKDIDLGKHGFPTAGDYAVESQPLLNPADGTTVGRSLTLLTIVRPVSGGQDFEIVLASTLRLEGGALMLQVGLRFSELFAGGTVAVVGGTGDYAGARGTVGFSPATVRGLDGFLLSIDVTTG
jgi:hypothetical protein